MKKKIYISGCGGMLGEAFYNLFKDEYNLKCTDINVNEEWISYLDFRNYKIYYDDVINYNPDYLFHLGAYTDLEFCENNKNETYLTNTISVENATFIANDLKIPLLYISTAGIFDGKLEEYDDWSQPNPIGHYAKTKYFAEKFVINNCHQSLICRAGWMMGGGLKKDKKFIKKIINQLIDGKKELYVVNDKLGTPTYTYDFANNIKYLIQNNIWGLFNMVCEGVTGRFEVTKEILSILNFSNIKLNSVDSNYFKDEYFVERPYSERLINKKLNLRKANKMRDWKLCLKEYIDSEFKNIINK